MLTVVDHPLVAEALAVLRDRETAQPEFRVRLRMLGSMLLMEAIADLPRTPRQVATPLASAEERVLARPLPCLVSVLRAGEGLVAGMIDLIPEAPVGVIGIRRDHRTLQPIEYYVNLPATIGGRLGLLADPMLATAGTAIAAVTRLKEAGVCGVRVLAALGAPEGVAALKTAHPDVPVFLGALDERLDERGYILPGLGDAGDRLFGTSDVGA
jgi:uracil phosphoribosyltransferase